MEIEIPVPTDEDFVKLANKISSFSVELEKKVIKFYEEEFKKLTYQLVETVNTDIPDCPNFDNLIEMLQANAISHSLGNIVAKLFIAVDVDRFRRTDGKTNIDTLKRNFDEMYNYIIKNNLDKILDLRSKKKDIATLARENE